MSALKISFAEIISRTRSVTASGMESFSVSMSALHIFQSFGCQNQFLGWILRIVL